MSTPNSTSSSAYQTLKTALLTHQQGHIFASLPTSPHALRLPQLQSQSRSSLPTISSLSLHPVLESILHLLNLDLPSAHFLVRHAQAAPAFESMYVHGILHRIELDVDNARAWYGDVADSEAFKAVWEGEEWKGFLDRVERWRDRVAKRKGRSGGEERDGNGSGKEKVDWEVEERELGEMSLGEMKRVLEFCEKKFGTGTVEDATKIYTLSGEKHKDIAAQMIVGGEGWREF